MKSWVFLFINNWGSFFFFWRTIIGGVSFKTLDTFFVILRGSTISQGLCLIKRKSLVQMSPWGKHLKKTLYFSVLNVFHLSCPGGFLHGINNLTYGVDIEQIRWLGILQVYFCPPSFFLVGFSFWNVYNARYHKELVRVGYCSGIY